MGIQFLLFAAINLGVEVLAERQRGLWKRLRSAPLSRATLLGGKLASVTVIGSLVLFVSFGVRDRSCGTCGSPAASPAFSASASRAR